MDTTSFQGRVVEFFTLREAIRGVANVPAEAPASGARGLRVVFQKREAAETLWPRGSTAEALKLVAAALEEASAVLAAYPMGAAPEWVPRAQTLVGEASKHVADIAPTMLEPETLPRHEADFRAAIEALLAIEDLARGSLFTPNDYQRIRATRIALTVAAVVLGVATLVRALHTPTFASATASGQHSDESGPSKAFDGDLASGWALPDHTGQGWIDFQLGTPRAIRTVHILASNPPYNDRDVKDARFDAMLDGVIVKSVDVTLPEPPGKEPRWNDVVLDAPKSDHLRITVKSNYKTGIAIDEIELK